MKLCPDCKRHVRNADVRCPFCGCGVPTTTALALAVSLGLAASLTGCGPVVDAGGSTGGADGSSDGPSDSTGSPQVGSTSGLTTAGPGESTAADETTAADATTFVGSTGGTESSSGVGFIEPTATGAVYGGECSIWDQDCFGGEKCVPWANDGGNAWNATRCTPIADDARAVGEPCTVMGSEASGVDDCEAEAYCFDVDPDTLEGMCVAFCDGSELDPSCPNPAQTCVIENEGTVVFCLDACDPFGEPCSEGRSCVAASQEQFVCVRPDAATLGQPCAQFTDCEAGASCLQDENGPTVCTSTCLPKADDCGDDGVCEPWGAAGLCAPP